MLCRAASLSSLPLSLYIHFPWCIKKCPYCDFNSYTKDCTFNENEQAYVAALLLDLQQDLRKFEFKQPKLHSIFMGGGTPSLFSPNSIAKILSAVEREFAFENDIEITMEVNPGTIDDKYLARVRELGVNRLSIGAQSFQDDKLQALGRIHNAKGAFQAVDIARVAGFENINLDIMFGLPKQSPKDAIFDLQMAISLTPFHISWYQLAIEAGAEFYRNPPVLPSMDTIWEMQRVGQEMLLQHNYTQYEVSAYSKPNYQCKHNLNYWLFGDYLGVGAGAHGKLTKSQSSHENDRALKVSRNCKFAVPEKYLQGVTHGNFIAESEVVPEDKLPFEFMLNALRLYRPIPFALFAERTGLDISVIADKLKVAEAQGLIKVANNNIITTAQGRNFLNDLLEIFV